MEEIVIRVYLTIGFILGFIIARRQIKYVQSKGGVDWCAEDAVILMGLTVWLSAIFAWPVYLAAWLLKLSLLPPNKNI